MSHTGLVVKYIKDHGYRVMTHDDGTMTIYVLNGDDLGTEIPFHVKNLKQARSAMGY